TVASVVDRGFGPQSAAFLMVLLNARSFVIDVEGRDHPVGDDSGAKRSRRASGHPAIEDQLNLLGASRVQILPYPFFEKYPSANRLVEHLGQRKLDLQDGELIAVSRLLVRGGERMGQ